MKRFSYWAKNNPAPARVFIVLLKVILATMAVYAGTSLSGLDILLSKNVLYVSVIASILTAFVYTGLSCRSYTFRKTCDMLLVIFTFIAILSFSNTSYHSGTGVMASVTPIRPNAQQILESLKYRDKSSLTRLEKKVLKKEFLRQVKNYSVATIMNDKEKSSEAALIILTIIAALGLAYLLAALSCSIACNGSETLAIVVALIGLAGLIWGTIAVIKSIQKRKQKKTAATTNQ